MSDAWVGRVIDGRYEVEAVLGEGGMGLVLRARHRVTQGPVAIKLLHEHLRMRGDLVQRFLAEAQAPARIRHPGIAGVTDAGITAEGDPFLVMELLEGESLADVVTRGPMPLAQVQVIGLGVLEALGAAHAAGFVHRDLKPENVFVTPSGAPKLLDFGIAKVLDKLGTPAPVRKKSTVAGQVLGTLGYMSPEQLRSSKDVDARTDVWSAGVMLYEMISGRLPYEASDVYEMVMAIETQKPRPLRSRLETVPPALEVFFERALARKPEDRFASATEMGDALRALPIASLVRSLRPGPLRLEPGEENGALVPGAPSAPPTGNASTVAALPRVADPSAATLAGGSVGQPAASSREPAPAPPRRAPAAQPAATHVSFELAEVKARPSGGGHQASSSPRFRSRVDSLPAPSRARALAAVGVLVVGVAVVAVVRLSPPAPGPAEAGPPASSTPPLPSAPAPLASAPPAHSPTSTKGLLPTAGLRCPAGMVLIAGGQYWVGSEGPGEADERPRHQATVSAFCLDAREVTTAAYRACVQRDPTRCAPLDGSSFFCNWGKPERDGHPINCVDWNQATAFCAEAGKRLPTEEEWEIAARGADERLYPWGDAVPANQLCWDGQGTELGKGRRLGTCPAGANSAGDTPDGLADLAGNVAEWTQTVYCGPYSARKCTPDRAVRGGAWDSNVAARVRGADRGQRGPTARDRSVGFRCARGPSK